MGMTRKTGDVLIVAAENGLELAIRFVQVRGSRAILTVEGPKGIRCLRKETADQIKARGESLFLAKPKEPEPE